MAVLIADILGLEVDLAPADLTQLFVGLDGGKYDLLVSSLAITEERKEKYDFASYLVAHLAFEARKGSGLRIAGPADTSGRIISVISGSNQETIMLDWNRTNTAAGRRPAELKNFPNGPECRLAVESGRADAFFGAAAACSYHVAAVGRTEIVGTISASGLPDVAALIGTVSPRGHGLAECVRDAVNELIRTGRYTKS